MKVAVFQSDIEINWLSAFTVHHNKQDAILNTHCLYHRAQRAVMIGLGEHAWLEGCLWKWMSNTLNMQMPPTMQSLLALFWAFNRFVHGAVMGLFTVPVIKVESSGCHKNKSLFYPNLVVVSIMSSLYIFLCCHHRCAVAYWLTSHSASILLLSYHLEHPTDRLRPIS